MTSLSVLVAAFGIAACGSDDDEGDSAGSGTTTAADGGGAPVAKTGGDAVMNLTSDPDFLDPALSYTQEGWNTLWTVYTGLLTYNHAEGAEGAKLIPGLAEALPEVAGDGLTYTLKLRDGLKYSDGAAVKASDFEHTIKRVLNLESGGSSFYSGIVGAEDYIEAGKARGDIEGITTDDATGEISIKLAKPDGSFSYYLAMDFAGIVPGDTPFENQTRNPPPGVGPYKIQDAERARGYTLARNDQAPQIEGIPVPKLDSIRINIVKNQRRQAQDILQSKVDYALDPPPADQKREVREQAGDRYEEYVTNSTYYYFLNNRIAPFDNKQVRQAINFAVDKQALARLFAGELEPGCNFLPPGMPGYKKIEPCPYGDPTQPANLAKARELIKAAGAEGTEVTVYGNDEEPSRPATEYLAEVMNSIGLKARPQIVEGSVYFSTIGNQKTKAQAGFANWFQDYPAPSNFVFLVNGDAIQETNNQNFGNVEDRVVTDTINKANAAPEIAEVADQYAAVDRRVVEEALVVPYGHRKLANFVSERVDFENCTVTHPVYQLDLTQLCFK